DLDVMKAYDAVWGDIADPWTLCRRYRREGPVVRGEFRTLFGYGPDPAVVGFEHYSAFGYEAVETALQDPVRFCNEPLHRITTQKAFGRILLVMDPPEHSGYR